LEATLLNAMSANPRVEIAAPELDPRLWAGADEDVRKRLVVAIQPLLLIPRYLAASSMLNSGSEQADDSTFPLGSLGERSGTGPPFLGTDAPLCC